MTADKLQSYVRILANQCFVRYWLHWNYPQREPWLMAICCIDYEGKNAGMYEPDFPGFTAKEERDGVLYRIAERTNEDGTPFETGRREI